MVHVFYHYANGVSRRGSRCRIFPTREDADRWAANVSRKYPKFRLDEIFETR